MSGSLYGSYKQTTTVPYKAQVVACRKGHPGAKSYQRFVTHHLMYILFLTLKVDSFFYSVDYFEVGRIRDQIDDDQMIDTTVRGHRWSLDAKRFNN